MSSFSRACATAFAAFLLVACAGCHQGVSWLPDSSGFVYTGGEKGRQLLLFDVKTKQSKVLVKDVGGPAWPAVSPDGKRIAVARRQRKDKRCWLTVAVYDREGRNLHQSKALLESPIPQELLEERETERDWLPLVGWSPRGDRLLLGNYDSTGLYEVKTRKVDVVPGTLLRVGHGVARPDGKGFLTVSNEGYSFVGWDRKAQKINTPENVVPREGSLGEVASAVTFYPSRWDGQAALLVMGERKASLRVDVAKLKVEEDTKADENPVYRLGKGVTAEIAPSPKGGLAWCLKVRREGAKAPRLLVDEATHIRCFPSPDGKWLAVGWIEEKGTPHSKKGTDLLVLDAKGEVVALVGADLGRLTAPQVIARLPGQAGAVHLLAFSREGKDLTVASEDGSLTRWDLTAKKIDKPTLYRRFGAAPPRLVALSADGSRFAAVSRRTFTSSYEDSVNVWDVATGKALGTVEDEADTLTALAISPDGKLIAAGAPDAVRLWNVETKKLSRSLQVHRAGPSRLAFSSDGKTLAVAGTTERDQTEYHVWDVQKGRRLTRVRCGDKGSAQAVDPAGKSLAVWGADESFRVRLWDLATSKQTATLRGHSRAVRDAAFSPDGRLLASAAKDGTVRLWDVKSGKNVATFWEHGAQCLAFSPDGKSLACAGGDGSVEVWRVPAVREK